MYITVHVYTMYVHGFTSCLSRFPEDGKFVQKCLYCVHTHINIHERVGTMYEHVCTTYIHLDIFIFMVQTCTYTGTFVIS